MGSIPLTAKENAMEKLTTRMESALVSGLNSPEGYVAADGRTKAALVRRGLISGPKWKESLTTEGLKLARELKGPVAVREAEELADRMEAKYPDPKLEAMTTEELEDQHQSASEARDWEAEERYRLELDRRRKAELTHQEAVAELARAQEEGLERAGWMTDQAQVDALLDEVLGPEEDTVELEVPLPRRTPEDLADLAQALAAEDLEHLEPEEVRVPKDPALRCQPGDVVTIHRGDRLYEVLKVEADSGRNNLTGEVADLTMARVAPCDPEDHRDPQWVHVDLLHVRGPVARLRTVQSRADRRVRYTEEVVQLPDGTLRRPALMVTDPQRQPSAHLVVVGGERGREREVPVATLRHGDAITLDGRAFRYVEGALEPARWRDRLPVS